MHSHECGDPTDPSGHDLAVPTYLLIDGPTLARFVPDDADVRVAAAAANEPGMTDALAIAVLVANAVDAAADGNQAKAWVCLRGAAVICRAAHSTHLKGHRP